MIRILLLDDHGIVREGIKRLLDTQADFEVCADALDKDPDTQRAMVTDVVQLEQMPPMFEALRHRTTQCKVLVDPRKRTS